MENLGIWHFWSKVNFVKALQISHVVFLFRCVKQCPVFFPLQKTLSCQRLQSLFAEEQTDRLSIVCKVQIKYLSPTNLLKLYILFCLTVLFLLTFGMRFVTKICLSLEYCEIILGFLRMNLLNYIPVLILGRPYLWTCWCKETKPSFSHLEKFLLSKY